MCDQEETKLRFLFTWSTQALAALKGFNVLVLRPPEMGIANSMILLVMYETLVQNSQLGTSFNILRLWFLIRNMLQKIKLKKCNLGNAQVFYRSATKNKNKNKNGDRVCINMHI